MTVWAWILVGIGGFFVVSLLVGLALAAILNSSARQFSELIELEAWASLPLTGTSEPENDIDTEHVARGRAGSSHLV
jgi:hypothetical protein